MHFRPLKQLRVWRIKKKKVAFTDQPVPQHYRAPCHPVSGCGLDSLRSGSKSAGLAWQEEGKHDRGNVSCRQTLKWTLSCVLPLLVLLALPLCMYVSSDQMALRHRGDFTWDRPQRGKVDRYDIFITGLRGKYGEFISYSVFPIGPSM